MKTEADHLWPALFHGWMELLTLLLILLVALTLWNWAHARRLRPAERGAATPWPLVLSTFALVLVLRTFDGDWLKAVVIAGAVLIGGWLGNVARTRALLIPAILLATLMGLGWMLSALVLVIAGFLILLLSARRS